LTLFKLNKNYILTSSLAKRDDRKFLRLLHLYTPSNNYKLAFTLAEVLITLLIIGVVSSLVIPNIIQDTQDAELKTALKKTYSTLSQAYINILSDNAGNLKDVCSGSFPNSTCLKNLFDPYLNINKSCTNSAAQGCWHIANKWYYINPAIVCGGVNAGIFDNCGNKTNGFPGYVLNDGSFMTIVLWDGTCTDTLYSNFSKCGYISFDVNGFKGPNTVGKDIFAIWIRDNRISPVGYVDVYQELCETHMGWGCTAKYLKE
jgi:prepilin-type N-terminal cleavage/methylation domain-containing protein